MNKVVILAAALLLAGCITHKPVALPSGEQGLAINCPGADRSIADCMSHAAKVCDGPYEIIHSDGSRSSGTVVPVGTSAMWVSSVQRTLIVSCK